ncbi:hypothetical protein HanIR_Chr04g0189241 [Helianthus annuus]|nr:hypothetical protein HanIR_Chr04g0189241 [Helianthus annuus]KAJ0597641.1 hypothetical protein HanHA89_Chr04g0156901 [Helianthus annuus]
MSSASRILAYVMSHSHGTIEIHDSESEHEFETSTTSVLPESPRTIPPSIDTVGVTLSVVVGLPASVGQASPRYAHTSNERNDDDDSIVPPVVFEIRQSSGTVPVINGNVSMTGGSLRVVPAVDATIFMTQPLEPLITPLATTIEPTPEIPSSVKSESSNLQSESRASTTPILVYNRRRKRTRPAEDVVPTFIRTVSNVYITCTIVI